ncbi:MAG: ABC transporter permease [Methanothrix sp.]|uniref:ABC transporter permease n=1 Tax=Methanothrix sp. TaxID=90426 RepID=UPI0031606960|nr:ABC transporter permease [Methanothrix sp.]
MKLARYAISLFIILSLNFAIPRAMPGDTLTNLLGEDVILSGDLVQEIRREMGLDLPLREQYLMYWKNLMHLDLGYSYHFHSAVLPLVVERMKWTLLLAAPPVIIGALLGTLLGALAGWREGPSSRLQTLVFLIIYSTPPYFLALMSLYIFGFHLGWVPMKGFYSTGSAWNIIHHIILPVILMSLFSASRNHMIMRGSVIQERQMLYALYARAKGLYDTQILFRHVFRNAALPIITLIALDFGFIFSGALFIEMVFSMRGMGNLIYSALLYRDYPVLQGSFLIITIMVITANMIADVLYGILDPRVRSR